MDIGIALSIFGVVIALIAFYFDIFGFRVDRNEAKETTRMLTDQKQTLDLIANTVPKKIVTTPYQEELVSSDAFTFWFIKEPYADEATCIVNWRSAQDDYAAYWSKYNGELYFQIHVPAMDHIEFESYLLGSGGKTYEQSMYQFGVDDNCDYVAKKERQQCFYSSMGENQLGVFMLEVELYLTPDPDEIREELFPGGLREYIRTRSKLYIDETLEAISEFEDDISEIKRAGGYLEGSYGFAYSLGKQTSHNEYEFSRG